MFTFAILIGIYSYLIFALGLAGLLYKSNIIILTVLLVITSIYFNRSSLNETFVQYYQVLEKCLKLKNSYKLIFLLTLILALQAFVNLIGALGPELAFDALWYHLTLPKLYLENHSIFYVPGGLLYYSTMPKLTEMLYIAALSFDSEILAKLGHLMFGILSCVVLFKLAREFLSTKVSLIAVVIFYSNLVVGWQSMTAYIDLARTFFEVMALWGFVKWWKSGDRMWLIESAIMLGLAISTKLLALGSLFIFSALIILFFMVRYSGKRSGPRISNRYWRFWTSLSTMSSRPNGQNDVKNIIGYLLIYWFIALVISLPWFFFSYTHTGKLVYPFFTDIYRVDFDIGLINPLRFINDTWTIFTQASDPISPIYIIFLPLVIIYFTNFKHSIKLIAFYSFLAIIVWYFTPRTGGGRFIMPYLPAFSIAAAAVLEKAKDKRGLKTVLISIILIFSIISIFYRGIANAKYIPVIVGKQTKDEFLAKNLNFSFGDFYDTDGYFRKNIKSKDKVLLYGFHNLYYVNFPYIDSSWIKKQDTFNYIAVQHTKLPKRFKMWDIIYYNSQTNVKLYSKGGIKWSY